MNAGIIEPPTDKIYILASSHYSDGILEMTVIQRAFKNEATAKKFIDDLAKNSPEYITEKTDTYIARKFGSKKDIIQYCPVYFAEEESTKMSKQRPWGDLLEANIDYALRYEKDIFEKFMETLKQFADMYVDMKIPYTYCGKSKWLSQFWWCLCRMYGETKVLESYEHSVTASYISKENLQICIDDLEYTINKVS